MVVDTPAGVALSCAGAVGPPGVVLSFLGEEAKGIHVSRFHKAVHPCSLFGKKAGAVFIVVGVFEVDTFVGDIVVAAKYDLLTLGAKLFTEFEYGAAEGFFVADSSSFVLAVGKVGIDQGEGGVGENLCTAFTVKFF